MLLISENKKTCETNLCIDGFLESCKHWSFIKFLSKKEFPFEISAIYYEERHFQRELQNNWSDDVCVLEKSLPLQHLRLAAPPHNPGWYPPEQYKESCWHVPPILTQGSSFSEKIAGSYDKKGYKNIQNSPFYHVLGLL